MVLLVRKIAVNGIKILKKITFSPEHILKPVGKWSLRVLYPFSKESADLFLGK